MHTIAILALHGVVPFDLATPCEVFGRVQVAGLQPAYQIQVCGEAQIVTTAAFAITIAHDLQHLAAADTVIVPGITAPLTPTSATVLAALRSAAARGTRIASICTGAFILAEAGLLDDQRATAHWLAAPELARRYPRIQVDPAVLFVDNGQILTSAGAAAGLDLCLHMVRRDYGAAVAAAAARVSVMPLERTGGQAQFIRHEPPSSAGTLDPLLRWLDQHLQQVLTLQDMAQHTGMSIRTLNRRFRQQTGTTPLQWLIAARVRRAQVALETTAAPINAVAAAVGFDSVTTFRAHFRSLIGTSPSGYRQSFGVPQAQSAPVREATNDNRSPLGAS